MKSLAFAAAVLGSGAVVAEEIAVLGPKERVVLQAGAPAPAPTDAGKAAFLAGFEKAVTSRAPFAAALPLENPPPWGKTISATTSGRVEYHRAFAGGFVCRLTLEHLLPAHRYRLTLNGNPEKQGNNLLPTPVPGLPAEKYYDFLDIETDASGRYAATLGVLLKRSAYDVRFYVKDTTDFKIVLYRDFFRFTVE